MALRVKDPFSGYSHLFGAVLSVAALVILVSSASVNSSIWHVVSFSIYGVSMTLLYLSSAAYHLIPLSPSGSRTLKRVDHIMIFFMIAGTYTPFCLVTLRGGWGWSIFGVIWGLAFTGIIFKILWLNAPRIFSTGIYLLMGWVCIIAIYPIIQRLSAGGVMWLAAGGVLYSVGAAVYASKRPDPYPGVFGFHEIWHLFVLAGSFCHFMVMMLYILPSD